MTVATRTNEEIKKDVVDQLYWDSQVDASNIKVEVSEGEVVLTGTVPNYVAYKAAAGDAWAMSGVKHVRNDLTIVYPSELKVPTDEEIHVNCENTLVWKPDIEATDIDVEVKNGWVTLRGTVGAFWQKMRAEEVVLGLTGVLGVTNELAVVPSEEVTDKAIADAIEAAMERHIDIDVDLVDLEVNKGKVTLSGSVPSLQGFRSVQTIAENTYGVIMVENDLVIR